LISNNPIYYIAVEGVIGAGKTSLAKLIAEKLNARLILENFQDNPYLEKFYQKPEEYAFRTQLFFLIERFSQLQQVKQKGLFQQYIVADYIFEKDRIFAYLTLTEEELKIYENAASSLNKNVVSPDLVIYLQSSVPRLLNNIRSRDRNIEKELKDEYIDALNDAYNYFFSRYKNSRVMIVNCEDIDFVNNKNDFESLVNEIFKPERTAVEYYNPALRKSAI
jgi:deoxyadenosine/deoxycytidine kinase